MDFANIYAQGFARVAARVLPITLGDPAANASAIIADATALSADGVCLAVYPELCLTGATCGDLFFQQTLLDATEQAIADLVRASANLLPVIVVGAPLRWQNHLYDCAVVVQGGQLAAVVPKVFIGDAQRRWFATGEGVFGWVQIPGIELGATLAGMPVIHVADVPGLAIGIEIGDELAAPIPPHAQMAPGGATVVANLWASPTNTGTDEARHLMARSASARCGVAYILAGAGWGESSTDAAWDGGAFIYECGDLLGQSARFECKAGGVTVDVDLRRLAAKQFNAIAGDGLELEPGLSVGTSIIEIATSGDGSLPVGDIGLRRLVPQFPFVPGTPDALAACCEDVYRIQVTALARRLTAVGPSTKAVIGVSGGLDSTNTLLVAAGAMDYLGRPHTDILGFTLPGFATSDGTKSNAWALMRAVGVTAEEIDIRPAARQMLADLGHADDNYDVTYENVQAGLRADYLFRAANQRGGLVVGTGDLSEAALGWCTYGVGDHMSHYNVNAGLPKTLMQHQIRWIADQGAFAAANDVLLAILEQEISPELVPGGALQSTEQTVGPYSLNDFFLYHMLEGASPSRIAYLAQRAFDGTYDLATIRAWLVKFYRRFFASQFKRSCSADGPAVLPVSLSPRGGWVMPSDVTPAAWLAELERDVPVE